MSRNLILIGIGILFSTSAFAGPVLKDANGNKQRDQAIRAAGIRNPQIPTRWGTTWPAANVTGIQHNVSWRPQLVNGPKSPAWGDVKLVEDLRAGKTGGRVTVVMVPKDTALSPYKLSARQFNKLGGVTQEQALRLANRHGNWAPVGLSGSGNHQEQSYIFRSTDAPTVATDSNGITTTTKYNSVSLTGRGISGWSQSNWKPAPAPTAPATPAPAPTAP